MDKTKVAAELVKIAKDLIAVGVGVNEEVSIKPNQVMGSIVNYDEVDFLPAGRYEVTGIDYPHDKIYLQQRKIGIMTTFEVDMNDKGWKSVSKQTIDKKNVLNKLSKDTASIVNALSPKLRKLVEEAADNGISYDEAVINVRNSLVDWSELYRGD